MRWQSAAVAVGLAATALAATPTTCFPGDVSGYCIDCTTSGSDLNFDVQFPQGATWVGLALGSDMAGVPLFVMYPNGRSGYTVSLRHSPSDNTPTPDSSNQGKITMGTVAGNVFSFICKGCANNALNYGTKYSTSGQQPIAYAVKKGSPANSADTSFGLSQHDYADTAQLNFAPSGSSSSVVGGQSTQSIVPNSAPLTRSSLQQLRTRHLVLALVAMGVYLLAGLLIRAVVHRALAKKFADEQKKRSGVPVTASKSTWTKVLVWSHAAAQLLASACLVWAICVGRNLLLRTGKTFRDAHPGFGLAIGSLVFLQIILGFVHHTCFGRKPRKQAEHENRLKQKELSDRLKRLPEEASVPPLRWPWEIFRFFHRYLGRIIFICFFINIVVGLNYADEPAGKRRSVTAAVAVALGVFFAAVLVFEFREHKYGLSVLRSYCMGNRRT